MGRSSARNSLERVEHEQHPKTLPTDTKRCRLQATGDKVPAKQGSLKITTQLCLGLTSLHTDLPFSAVLLTVFVSMRSLQNVLDCNDYRRLLETKRFDG